MYSKIDAWLEQNAVKYMRLTGYFSWIGFPLLILCIVYAFVPESIKILSDSLFGLLLTGALSLLAMNHFYRKGLMVFFNKMGLVNMVIPGLVEYEVKGFAKKTSGLLSLVFGALAMLICLPLVLIFAVSTIISLF